MSNEEVVRRYWEAHRTGDLDAESALRHPDWFAEYPQLRERIRGDANQRAIIEHYPGGPPRPSEAVRIVGTEDRYVVTPAYTVERIVGDGDAWWADGTAIYPDGSLWYFVVMMELRDGLVARETAFYAAPMETPAWRLPWIERMDPS